ncbi:unnamed protein product [Cuscuta europaea]|uniref:KIB1-4 beta-propeller domain-containing protein n=1 Tax=Cuscuta europaea TaxID=41803 RepID=A0A9P0ZV72_CUSEU|nr:unnamed protein product [Cuscuta europaea]
MAPLACSSSPVLLLPLEETTSFMHNNVLRQNLKKTIPIGSSYGWLILLDETTSEPFLLNPFDQTKIQLPKKSTFPHITSIKTHSFSGQEEEHLTVEYKGSSAARVFTPMEDKRPLLSIKKAVLSANPSTNKDFVVFVLYGEDDKVAYCRNGDKDWRNLGGQCGPCYDITCLNGMMYALGKRLSVERWDSSSLKKTGVIHPPLPRGLFDDREEFPADLYARKWYIIPFKSGEMFFVVRHIGEFVTEEGKVVYEEAMYEDGDMMICPYRTMGFRVYKLDMWTETWEPVKTLNGRVVFLGGNHSVSLLGSDHPNRKPDCIYFTDDYWDRVDEDYSYGGHDMGVFCLKDNTFEHFLDFHLQKFTPPPFWLIPDSS